MAHPQTQENALPPLAGAGPYHMLRGLRISDDLVLRLGLTVTLFVALALRLKDLGDDSLWYDEVFGLALARQPLSVVMDVVTGFVANMALYLVGMHFWMQLFPAGVSDAIPRLPSVILGVGGVAAVYALGAELANRRAGLASAFLLAVNPYHVGWSQDARAYTLWALMVTLTYLALVRAVNRPRLWTWWVAYGLLTVVSFYSHLFTVFVVFSQGLWILLLRDRSIYIRYAVVGIGIALGIAPLLMFGTGNTDLSQLRAVPLPTLKDARTLLRSYTGGEWLQYLYTVLIVGAVAFALVRPNFVKHHRSRMILQVLWLLVLPVTVLGLSFVYKPLFRERYVFAVLPALCLLAGIAATRLRPAALGLAIVAVITALSLSGSLGEFNVRRNEDWRRAVGYLVEQARPDDGFIFISRRNHLPWQYYAPGFGRDPYAIHDIEPFDWAELAHARTYRAPAFDRGDLDRFAQTHPRIWLVLSHEFDAYEDQDAGGDTSSWVRDRLTRIGFAARQRVFPAIRVLLYERRSDAAR